MPSPPLTGPTPNPSLRTSDTGTWCIIKQQCRLSRLSLHGGHRASQRWSSKGYNPSEEQHLRFPNSPGHICDQIGAVSRWVGVYVPYVCVVSLQAQKDPLRLFIQQVALATCVSFHFSAGHAILCPSTTVADFYFYFSFSSLLPLALSVFIFSLESYSDPADTQTYSTSKEYSVEQPVGPSWVFHSMCMWHFLILLIELIPEYYHLNISANSASYSLFKRCHGLPAVLFV